jgi:hypothetical protein
MLERERKIAIRLLITGSGVRVPHNPQLALTCGMFCESRRCIRMNKIDICSVYVVISNLAQVPNMELKPEFILNWMSLNLSTLIL